MEPEAAQTDSLKGRVSKSVDYLQAELVGSAAVTGKAVKSSGETMTAAFAAELLTVPVAAAASDKTAVFGAELGKEAADLGIAEESAAEAAAAVAAMTDADAERLKGPKTGYPYC